MLGLNCFPFSFRLGLTFFIICEELDGCTLEELDDEIDDEKVIKAFSKANKKIQKNKELEKRMKAAEKKAKRRVKELDIDEDDVWDIFRKISIF